MANIMQMFTEYKDEQERKIAGLSALISKVIEEFMNATENFSERDDLSELFFQWDYMFDDDIFIYIRESEKGTMRVWEQTSCTENAYSYVYDDNAFKEVNAFLEKNFPWARFKINVYAYVCVTESSIELEFIPREDILSSVPENRHVGFYLLCVIKAMETLLKRSGAEDVTCNIIEDYIRDVTRDTSTKVIEDMVISATYHLN